MQPEPADAFNQKLALLPHRALVAFAARCAWRVSPLLAKLPEKDRGVIEDAIRAVELVAAGSPISYSDIDAAYRSVNTLAGSLEHHPPAPGSLRGSSRGASRAASADYGDTAWMACLVCARACGIASVASHGKTGNEKVLEILTSLLVLMCRAIIRSVQQDIENEVDILISLDLGQAGTPGDPVDTGEAGPLGFLWPGGEPDWAECRFGA